MVEFQYLDKRVQRTKINLYKALLELLEQKKYEQITIKDIIDFAGYSRGTFYIHYKQKDDLLNEIIDYLFNEAIKAQRSSYINEDSINIQKLDNEPIFIIKHFQQYGKYYKILLGENLQIDFSRKLTNLFVNLYLEDFEMQDPTDENAIDKNLINKYYAYGLIGLIMEWVIADCPTEPEVFSEELVKIFKYSLGTIQIIN
ncbi:TetR/AcrR family transcriptional regulator [Sporosarcina sp. ACRSL]|uniref:TetR/AcrR family transcriptional regulator n=1 Tax=Sporosarcina sp. ACRSL TaxID=2918215 RepID=UPI001EF52406|nr:TetR/AcrR family transcriptional regulator [Sporosarcina sp. ACRSL]MCG7344873.1 TetR/AcrR family transcriptional regulator [Sporosarcina sp. ACRSL]